MTNLRKLLERRGIRRAVVIDDMYDEVPRPDELVEDDWTIFFADLGGAGNRLLSELYTAYEGTQVETLMESQEFVNIVWNNRKQLPANLFEHYENIKKDERRALDELVEALEALGLTCTPMGRDFGEDAKQADLIFVDLFLGVREFDGDVTRAVQRVSELVCDRVGSPPLVVLMSRSTRLLERRDEFRDNAGLVGSTFRAISKVNLAKDGELEMLLTRLASHYEDAKRIAAYVHAWDDGLKRAQANFLRILRRLDLPDLAQVQALVLDVEGQMLGEYLLDVADRVLQHEIEAEKGTIAAAQELNKIELARYPAPHLAGSPDLQDLVRRMIFQHVERLKLSLDGEAPIIQYGDVLRCKNKESGTPTNEVLLVVTPACDLARGGLEHVLVLPGTLNRLTARDWDYGTAVAKTPVFESEDGSRYWIKWNLKGRQTVDHQIVTDGLRDETMYERVGRIREIYAAEIQQRMLADMGRIGRPANPPATFPVSIAMYAVSPEGKASPVEVEGLDTAVCFVGRDGGRNGVDRLVLDEKACDALARAIRGYRPEDVFSAARRGLEAMKADADFFERFERGLIEVRKAEEKWKKEGGANNLAYLHVVRGGDLAEGFVVKGDYRNTPFVMKVSDIETTTEE